MEFLHRGLQVHDLDQWLLRFRCWEVLCRGVGGQDDWLIHNRWRRQRPAASPPWWLRYSTRGQEAPLELGVTAPQPVPPDPISLRYPLSVSCWADCCYGPQCPELLHSSVPRHPPADWGVNHWHFLAVPGTQGGPAARVLRL